MTPSGRRSLTDDLIPALDLACAAVLVGFVGLIPFDLRAIPLVQATALGSCALALAQFGLHLNSVRWPRVGIVAGVWVAITGLGIALRKPDDGPDFLSNETPAMIAMTFSAVLLLEVAWIRLQRGLEQTRAERVLARYLGAMAALFALIYASCYFSLYPRGSISSFGLHGAGPQLVFLGLFMVLLTYERSADVLFDLLAIVGAVGVAAALVVLAMGVFGGESQRGMLEAVGAIRDVLPDGGPFAFIVQFPFFLHNRLGYFALMAGFAGLVVLTRHRVRGLRTAGYVLFVVAVVIIMASRTRGAIAGAGAGLAAFLLASPSVRSVVRIGLVAVGVFLIAFAAIGPFRQSVEAVTVPRAVHDPGGTVSLRLYSFQGAWQMGIRHPLAGIGYGPHAFRREYTANYRDKLGDPEIKDHPYNSALELWSGSGPLAGLLFVGLAVAALGKLWRERTLVAGAPAALGMLTAMLVYGGSNTIIQGTIGGAIWLVLVACMALPRERST